jgi:SRSO17 transposase
LKCETELLVQAGRIVGGNDAVLVIDDTAILKKGAHSVGVAPQYASANPPMFLKMPSS